MVGTYLLVIVYVKDPPLQSELLNNLQPKVLNTGICNSYVIFICPAVASEYSEFEDDILETAVDESSAMGSQGIYDGEAPSRREAMRIHRQRSLSRGSSFTKPDLKRGTSRSDLKRQLSKQRSMVEGEGKEEGATVGSRIKLIEEERTESGTVRFE